MTRCLDECGKKWRVTEQIKSGWQKQKEKKERKEKRQQEKKKIFRKLMVEEKMKIARVIEEKKEEKNLIKIKTVEEMVPRWFYKYLKMFKKKKSERMPMRKIWDHAIDLREEFVLKRGKIYPLSKIERKEV